MMFGKKVFFVRSKLLKTHAQLAKEVGVALSTVARW